MFWGDENSVCAIGKYILSVWWTFSWRTVTSVPPLPPQEKLSVPTALEFARYNPKQLVSMVDLGTCNMFTYYVLVSCQWPMSRPSARRILSIHPCTVWPACVIPTITKPIKADTLCIWQSFGLWSSWDQPWEVTVDPGSHLLPEHPRVSTVLAISVIFVAPSQISWSRFPKLTICIPSTRSASVKLS